MEIKLDGYLTKEQYLLARKLAQRKIKPETAGKLRVFIEGWVLFLLIGVVFGIIAIGLLIYLKFFIGAFIAILALLMIVIGYKARKSLEELGEKIDGMHITGQITEEEIVLTTPTIHNRLSWEAFSGYGEEGDIVLLVFTDSHQTQIISKQYFSDEQAWQEFKGVVAQRLPLTYSLHQKYIMEKKDKLRLWLVSAIMVVILFMAILSNYR